MAATRKLTPEEVEALIEGLGSASASGSGLLNGSDAEVRPFMFGSDDLSLLGDYHALRMINERFCRMARAVFFPFLRIQPRISSFPPEVQAFDLYVQESDTFVSLTTSRMEELRGSQLMVIQPGFISLLTDSYYGGTTVQALKRYQGEFTATEQRVIEIVTDGLIQSLQTAWRDLLTVTIGVQGREENIQFASFVDGSDTVIVCSFVVQLPRGEPAQFDVIYPLQTLKPIASQLRSRVQSEFVQDDMSWRQKLEQAILNIPLQLTAEIAQPTTSLRNLIHLQEGDVYPMQLHDGIRVKVEDRAIFEAQLGQVGTQTALNLTRRIQKEEN
jgi:flagellar motor switch protein FliM